MTDTNTFTFTNTNPGVSSLNSEIKFKTINSDHPLDELSISNENFIINNHSKLSYADLTGVLNTNKSYSIDFTITESQNADPSKNSVYLALGKHNQNGVNDCLCVYRNTSGRVTLGIVQGSSFETQTPITFGSTESEQGVEYVYTLTHNHLALGSSERVRLYRTRSDGQLDINNQLVNLISATDIITNISTPYLFLGTSYTVLIPGWESVFDISYMSVKEVNLYVNKVLDPSFLPGTVEYPVTLSVLNTDTTKNTNYVYCEIGDIIELKFHSPRLVSPANVKAVVGGLEMEFMSTNSINITNNENIYISIEYTYRLVVTEQYPSNPFEYSVDFNGTETELIRPENNIFISRTVPTITYEINDVTSTAVYIKLTSISDDLYDFFNTAYDGLLSLTFSASDGAHVTLSVSATDFAIGSIHTIDTLTPVETIWNISATITDINHSNRTNTISPTVNTFQVNDNINQILNGEIDKPIVSNSSVTITHVAGDDYITISNVKSYDVSSNFSTYAALFDSNTHTVTETDITDAGNAMISMLDVPKRNDFVSLDGTLTHVRKWNGSAWDPASLIEYNTTYYLYVYSVDLSSNQNFNKVFVESYFASVNVGFENQFYELGLETVSFAHILSAFSERVSGDTVSTQYVGYDSSGNNNHILVELIDPNVSPIVPSNGSLNKHALQLSNVAKVLVPNQEYTVFKSTSLYSISFFINKSSWDDSFIIYDNQTGAEFIAVTETEIRVNHSISSDTIESTVFSINLLINTWKNITITYDTYQFKAYVNGTKVTPSAVTELHENYSGVSRDLRMTTSNTLLDAFRVYTTVIDTSLIETLMNQLYKTVDLGLDTEGYVFIYNVIVNNDAIQINEDSVLHTFNVNGIYTFYQTNSSNSHPIMLEDSNSTGGDNSDINYYIDDVIVTRDYYITNFLSNNNRKIVFIPTSVSLSSSLSIISTNANITPIVLTIENIEIDVHNKGNYENPTFDSVSYTRDAAVNGLAYRFNDQTNALTFPNVQIAPSVTVSTWVNISSLPDETACYPIVRQSGVFEFGIDTLGRLYFDNFYRTQIRFEINVPSGSGNVTINEIELYDINNEIIPYSFVEVKSTTSTDILTKLTNADLTSPVLEYTGAVAGETLFVLQLLSDTTIPTRVKLYNYSCQTTPGYNVYMNNQLVSFETNEGDSTLVSTTSDVAAWIQDIYFNKHYNTLTYKIHAYQVHTTIISISEIKVYDINDTPIDIGFVNLNIQRKSASPWNGNDPNSLTDNNLSSSASFDWYVGRPDPSGGIGSTLFKLVFPLNIVPAKIQIAYTRADLSPGIETYYNGILIGTQSNLGSSTTTSTTFDAAPKHEIILLSKPTLENASDGNGSIVPPGSGLLINLSISAESIFAIDSREIQRFDADTNEWNTLNANELVYSDATHATYYANEYGQSYQFRLLEKHIDKIIPDIASDTLTVTTETIGSSATSYDFTTQNFELSTPESNFTIADVPNIVTTTGTNNYMLSKNLIEFPLYIECEIKSTTESVGLYLTTSDSQLSDTPFTKTLFWGTGKTNVSRYDWGIYDVSNTSYNGIAYNDQYDSLAETFQKFAVYCDDQRAYFYKDNLLMYQFSRTQYPDFWTHVEESTHGVKFGVFSSEAEMKNFKTSPNRFAPGTYAYDIQTVSYTTTFDAQWNEMNSIEQREFEDQFKAVSAQSLGVPIDNVIIHSITQGSVIVEASVYVTTDTGITTTDVMNTLSDTSIYTGGILGDTPPTISSIVTGLSSVIGELPKTPASPPTVTKGEITLNSIQIEWTPESNGDAKLIKYAVLVDNVIVDDTISTTVNSYTITSLEPGTDYTIIVRKVTSLGNSDSSEETVRITTASAPIIQTIESPTETSRDITWTPEDHGDAVVEKYAILLDGVIIQDDISKDTFTWSLTNINTDTSNQSFNVRKFTNLGNIDSTWVSLRVHYDFNTSTLDEQVTYDSLFTLHGSTTHTFETIAGSAVTWLRMAPLAELYAPIGPLLPRRNFTWQVRYFQDQPDQDVSWTASFGGKPDTGADTCDRIEFGAYDFYSTKTGPDVTLTNFDITYSKVGATTLPMEEFVGGVTTWFVNRGGNPFTRYPEELNGGIHTRLYNHTTYANVHFYSPHETICYGFYAQWLDNGLKNVMSTILDGMGFGPIETSMTAPGFDISGNAYNFHLRKATFPAGAIEFPALSTSQTLSIGAIHLVFQRGSGGSVRFQLRPEPTLHGDYLASQSELRTSITHSVSTDLYQDGTLETNAAVRYGGDHVFTGVCNTDQTTGVDLATPPGTISLYIDNFLIKTIDVSPTFAALDEDFEFTADRLLCLSGNPATNHDSFRFGSLKIFDGVVDMSVLNELQHP